MKAKLIDAGIDASRLASERLSYDSRTNVQQMLALAQAQSVKRLILVSDPLHLHRLLFMARDQAAGLGLSLRSITAYPSRDPLAFLWRPHYEAIAWFAELLPRGLYENLLLSVRK